MVRFHLPLIPDDPEQPVWSVIRKLSDRIGEGVTSHMRAIAKANPLLAKPLYLTTYIRRMGTGTRDMIDLCVKSGVDWRSRNSSWTVGLRSQFGDLSYPWNQSPAQSPT